jgi:glycosyltransferase involved in cell wall biosynthesis
MTHKKTLALSIVIPVFNEQRYIKACLDSIAAQAVMPDEVIVVDNNSTDKTVQIAKKYPFVRVVYEKKQNVVFARDAGFKAARSNIIGRIDADTILPQYWVKNVIKSFESASVAAVTGPVAYYDMPFPNKNYRFNHLMCKYTHKWSPKSPFLYGSNMAIRKSVWNVVAKEMCHEQSTHEDIDLAIHLYQRRYKIVYTLDLLAKASGRRYNDKLSEFARYVSMYSRTYNHHGLRTVSMYFAMFMWSLGYIIMRPWRIIWFSVYAPRSRYPVSSSPRKNPAVSV